MQFLNEQTKQEDCCNLNWFRSLKFTDSASSEDLIAAVTSNIDKNNFKRSLQKVNEMVTER